jgi:hypothetical protein
MPPLTAQQFYQLGHATPTIPYGQSQKLAKEARVNAQTLRYARQLARLVTPAEFKDLQKECKKRGIKPGYTLFVHLLSVPPKEWVTWIDRVAKRDLSNQDLMKAIVASKYHARRSVGRHPKIPKDAKTRNDQLRRLSEQLLRYIDEASKQHGPFTDPDVKTLEKALRKTFGRTLGK